MLYILPDGFLKAFTLAPVLCFHKQTLLMPHLDYWHLTPWYHTHTSPVMPNILSWLPLAFHMKPNFLRTVHRAFHNLVLSPFLSSYPTTALCVLCASHLLTLFLNSAPSLPKITSLGSHFSNIYSLVPSPLVWAGCPARGLHWCLYVSSTADLTLGSKCSFAFFCPPSIRAPWEQWIYFTSSPQYSIQCPE